jgi:LPPG:FO 2-phospho-L-lactate transferase
VTGFRFDGGRPPALGVLAALDAADLVVLCPSNPWVSIDPIRAVPGVEDALRNRPVIAVSPIIGGRAVKGPAAKMFAELGVVPTAAAVADHYRGLLQGFVIDHVDEAEAVQLSAAGLAVHSTEALMRDRPDRARLAAEVLALYRQLPETEKV